MTTLERIESLVGTVTAYDGRLCFWAQGMPRDVRDVARALGCDAGDICDAMPVFERVKRGRSLSTEPVEDTPENK